jgi:hypothetical protein
MMTDRTALLGITTPLSDLSMTAPATGTVVAIVCARLGVLSADNSTGAAVRGNGSNLLWISGTTAQVNAKLATLTYASTTAGTDDLSVFVLAADGTLIPALRSQIAVIPLSTAPQAANSLVDIDYGTLTLESRTLDGPNLSLREPAGSQNSTTCVLINSTIGAHSQISVRNDNSAGGVMPRIAIAGRVELDGAMTFVGNGAAVSIAQGATFSNDGSISIDARGTQFTGNGAFVNNGLILVTGTSRIDTALSGSGTVSLEAGASVEIGASVGASETIWLGAGANTLHLAQPAAFAGQIAGFSSADLLVLDGATVTSAFGSTASESDSTIVTLFNGTSVVGTLRFSATEPGAVFQLGADAAGNPTIALAPTVTSASTDLDVFRFFDAAHGTQLLTQDAAERNAIISSRPDLQYEGVGLHALNPAQPGATSVYRFFDISNGTHFLTADAAERDSLLATRPDMVFEPSSTLFEHATAQAGDSAVYRFFDKDSGAHFFTADAGERASILATRPDMTLEGIAFYAPTT